MAVYAAGELSFVVEDDNDDDGEVGVVAVIVLPPSLLLLLLLLLQPLLSESDGHWPLSCSSRSRRSEKEL